MAARMIPANGLAGWAELWETVHARKAEAQTLNLDRKSMILEIFARMQAAARG
jgi:DNA polymerase-3 subunit delta'